MLVKAQTRQPSKRRAAYLLRNKVNDRVEVLDVRGTLADSAEAALSEMNTRGDLGKGKKARQTFLSANINPQPGYDDRMTQEQWVRCADIAEQMLGLTGQPRVIVQHEKKGTDGVSRTHIHVDWLRVDNENHLVKLGNMRHKCVAAKIQMENELGHPRTKDYDLKEKYKAQGRVAAQMLEAAREMTPGVVQPDRKKGLSQQDRLDRLAHLFIRTAEQQAQDERDRQEREKRREQDRGRSR
ncbi:MAG: relaxase/mobilization nuclease domain-containing protein [Janthinobacterium lividum]